jgi:hypothetical protein
VLHDLQVEETGSEDDESGKDGKTCEADAKTEALEFAIGSNELRLTSEHAYPLQ